MLCILFFFLKDREYLLKVILRSIHVKNSSFMVFADVSIATKGTLVRGILGGLAFYLMGWVLLKLMF